MPTRCFIILLFLKLSVFGQGKLHDISVRELTAYNWHCPAIKLTDTLLLSKDTILLEKYFDIKKNTFVNQDPDFDYTDDKISGISDTTWKLSFVDSSKVFFIACLTIKLTPTKYDTLNKPKAWDRRVFIVEQYKNEKLSWAFDKKKQRLKIQSSKGRMWNFAIWAIGKKWVYLTRLNDWQL